jgi:hypothetical protein
MKTIDLSQQTADLLEVLELVKDGPLVVITPDGREYVLAEADDFEQEVAQLRASTEFQRFLDARLATRQERRPVADVLREIETILAGEHPATTD